MFKRKFPFDDVVPIQSKLYVNSKVFNDISCSSEFERKLICDKTISRLKEGSQALKSHNSLNDEYPADMDMTATKIDKSQMTIKFNGQLSRSPMKICSNQASQIYIETNNNENNLKCSSCKVCADETSTCAWCNIQVCNYCYRFCIACGNFYCHLCSVLEYNSASHDHEAFCLQCIENNNF